MSRNRYIGDYHLADSLDERGRIRTEVEYVGNLYSFVQEPEKVSRTKKTILCMCAVGWLAYISALIPVSTAARTVYSVLPFVFIAVPLGLLSATALEILPQKERFIHRYADRIDNRLPASAVFITILACVSLVGETVNLIRGLKFQTGDLLFSGGAVLLFLTGVMAHRSGKALKCCQIY